MSKNGNSLHRPYEVIETEETVTRYFKPSHSKVPTNSSKNNPSTKMTCHHHEPFVQNDPRFAKDDGQLQALYEKFNNLRTEMSELSEKFKEINLAKSKAQPTFDGADTFGATDFSSTSCQKIKSNEDLLDNDVVLEDSREYKSRVSVVSLTDQHQTQASEQQVIGDGEAKGCRTEFPNDDYHKRVDALLLKRSKTLLISLIDKELQRLQPSQETCLPEKSHTLPCDNPKHLKMECINRIGEELAVLKDLEVIEDVL